MRGRQHEFLRVVVLLQLTFELPDLDAVERFDFEQAVDEEAIAARRRHPSGRGMRARDKPHLFEIGHDVANRSGAKPELQSFGKRAGSDRVTCADVRSDDQTQNLPASFIELKAVVSPRHGNFLITIRRFGV